MINSTDLRIQFKIDTGEYPVWVVDRRPYKVRKNAYSKKVRVPEPIGFLGRVKSKYGAWVEKKLGNEKELRDEYWMEFHESPIWPKPKDPGSTFEGFKIQYTLWLEEKYINTNKLCTD